MAVAGVLVQPLSHRRYAAPCARDLAAMHSSAAKPGFKSELIEEIRASGLY